MNHVLAALAAFSICFNAFGQSVLVEAVHCIDGRFGMKLPKDAREIRTMAPLIRETVSEVERWEGYTATRRILYFDGLELGIVDFSNDPSRLMLTYAEVSSPRWNRLLPFKIRQPVSIARHLFGDYAKNDPNLIEVYASESDSVQVHASGGSVVSVSYRCYSG
ncbi:hypothetical protein SNE35_19345 [Paucibacter sp. R3-3]|uniref:Uncharacterized protein n=1 Tax=Roseateles agri TaxID=3098619 RepID=A0ABU5DK49_9BURK|nr:hypothetical protein [Paucibacter sp. R3-3]MDY0746677.1 hypothetical protein [Paucibacter sp. R3-3]